MRTFSSPLTAFPLRKLILKSSLLLLLLLPAAFINAQSTYYVKQNATGDGSSWANASGDLQAMINTAAANDQIWVAAGTYKPNRRADTLNVINPDNRYNAFVLKADVKIYGGFPTTGMPVMTDRNPGVDTTILSGDIGTLNKSTDNCLHVVIASGNVGTAVLDGFTISHGYAYGVVAITVNGNQIDPTSGGGLFNYVSSPNISNCIFLNDSAYSNGGGIYSGAAYNTPPSLPAISNCIVSTNAANFGGGVYNSAYSSPTITNSNFLTNTANASGGGLVTSYSSTATQISHCNFSDNLAKLNGGGMYLDGDTILAKNCTFSGNMAKFYGGAIYDTAYRLLKIMNCVFINNSVQNGGAALFNTGPVKLLNSVFINNKASASGSNGGAIYNTYGSLNSITNCTIYGNIANGCGGIYNSYYNCCTPTPTSISNCIVWANTGTQIQDAGSASTVKYSLVQGSAIYPGIGNANANPLFIDTTTIAGADGIVGTPDDGIALKSISPAVNTGNDSLYEIADGNANNNSLTNDLDIAANPRVSNYANSGIIDMGAYEAGPVYTFTGSGNWTDTANWQGGIIPPSPLPDGSSIIISGQAVLDTTQTISANARITVLSGATLALLDNLIQQ